jgi:hypothetical protein
MSLAIMDPPSDDDDECFLVQLDSSDMFSKASKVVNSMPPCLGVVTDLIFNQTILRQRFLMRQYNWEPDSRLTNFVKAME